jgi:hypothetical protein
MLTFGSGKSGRCSRPETKTEPAKKKLESDFRGSSESSSSRVLAVVGKIQNLSLFFPAFSCQSSYLAAKMKLASIAFLSFAAAASASWTKNLNYRSPSEHHPFMGIAIHKVVAIPEHFTHTSVQANKYSSAMAIKELSTPSPTTKSG